MWPHCLRHRFFGAIMPHGIMSGKPRRPGIEAVISR
jgi:hypothetical protein